MEEMPAPSQEPSPDLDPGRRFDQDVLMALGCLKTLNFRHVAWIGRELDGLPEEKAYQVLWHREQPRAEKAFNRLKKLCGRRLVMPWRSWNPDHILLSPRGRASARRSGVFYILARDGREWLRSKFNIALSPGIVEELYQSALPLGPWLTAASCALTLQSQGYGLVPVNSEWKERMDTPFPRFKPDFIVRRQTPMAFYIYDSPFGLRAEYFVAHVGRGLNFLSSDGVAVILTRTEAAFSRIFTAMKGKCLSANKDRVYAGDLKGFYKARCHTTTINGEERQITL
jgi:hypothetical protein